ncbi:MAG: hypothetical protein DRJ38_05385 [Thermoprotei archaeon]|nr:MAG: hypothetical protein DRJ38_05385 [Thermoprotei archaeon]
MKKQRGLLEMLGEPSLELIGYVILAIILLYIILPMAWLFITAFAPTGGPYLRIPESVTLENFAIVFGLAKLKYGAAAMSLHMDKWIVNSLIIAIVTTVVTVILVSMAGYALSRLKFRGKSLLMTALLVLGMMPTTAKLLPLYKLCISFGFINNLIGVAIVIASGLLPTQIWIMKGFFDYIPRDLEEQAWIFGCSKLETLFKVVLPCAGPGITVVAFLSFLAGWGNFTVPLILIRTETLYPISLGIATTFIHHPGEVGLAVPYGPLCALSLIYVIPSMCLYFISRKYLMAIKLGRLEV